MRNKRESGREIIPHENCRFLSPNKKECVILKKLYYQTEPCKKCAWYKKKARENNDTD